jgi:diketogulonate reductase-like aldo/keto reductase
LDYVDLYLIHWPVTGIESETLTPTIEETWGGMEDVLALGLTKTIGVSTSYLPCFTNNKRCLITGVSNFSLSKLAAMKSYAKVFPSVNQVELHPVNRQTELLAGCKEMNVIVTAYSPLGSPSSSILWNLAPVNALTHPLVLQIASELSLPGPVRSAGQVLIRWGIQRGVTIVPKSVTPSRIIENLDVFSFELTDTHMELLSSLPVEGQMRACDGSFWLKEGGPYRTMEELWA